MCVNVVVFNAICEGLPFLLECMSLFMKGVHNDTSKDLLTHASENVYPVDHMKTLFLVVNILL